MEKAHPSELHVGAGCLLSIAFVGLLTTVVLILVRAALDWI
jgi:hypothetical protein